MRQNSFDSGIGLGLPRWLLTRKFAVAAVIFLPLTIMALGDVLYELKYSLIGQSTNAPECIPGLGQNKIIKTEDNSFDPEDSKLEVKQRFRRKNLEKLFAVLEECELNSCSGKKRSAFERAATKYLYERGRAMRSLYAKYGKEGLWFVESLYSGERDVRALSEIKKRAEKDLIRLRRASPDKENIVRTFLFRPNNNWKLCLKGDA